MASAGLSGKISSGAWSILPWGCSWPLTISSVSATAQPRVGCKTRKSTAPANPTGQWWFHKQEDLVGQRPSGSECEVLSSCEQDSKELTGSSGRGGNHCVLDKLSMVQQRLCSCKQQKKPASNKVKGKGQHNAVLWPPWVGTMASAHTLTHKWPAATEPHNRTA